MVLGFAAALHEHAALLESKGLALAPAKLREHSTGAETSGGLVGSGSLDLTHGVPSLANCCEKVSVVFRQSGPARRAATSYEDQDVESKEEERGEPKWQDLAVAYYRQKLFDAKAAERDAALRKVADERRVARAMEQEEKWAAQTKALRDRERELMKMDQRDPKTVAELTDIARLKNRTVDYEVEANVDAVRENNEMQASDVRHQEAVSQERWALQGIADAKADLEAYTKMYGNKIPGKLATDDTGQIITRRRTCMEKNFEYAEGVGCVVPGRAKQLSAEEVAAANAVKQKEVIEERQREALLTLKEDDHKQLVRVADVNMKLQDQIASSPDATQMIKTKDDLENAKKHQYSTNAQLQAGKADVEYKKAVNKTAVQAESVADKLVMQKNEERDRARRTEQERERTLHKLKSPDGSPSLHEEQRYQNAVKKEDTMERRLKAAEAELPRRRQAAENAREAEQAAREAYHAQQTHDRQAREHTKVEQAYIKDKEKARYHYDLLGRGSCDPDEKEHEIGSWVFGQTQQNAKQMCDADSRCKGYDWNIGEGSYVLVNKVGPPLGTDRGSNCYAKVEDVGPNSLSEFSMKRMLREDEHAEASADKMLKDGKAKWDQAIKARKHAERAEQNVEEEIAKLRQKYLQTTHELDHEKESVNLTRALKGNGAAQEEQAQIDQAKADVAASKLQLAQSQDAVKVAEKDAAAKHHEHLHKEADLRIARNAVPKLEGREQEAKRRIAELRDEIDYNDKQTRKIDDLRGQLAAERAKEANTKARIKTKLGELADVSQEVLAAEKAQLQATKNEKSIDQAELEHDEAVEKHEFAKARKLQRHAGEVEQSQADNYKDEAVVLGLAAKRLAADPEKQKLVSLQRSTDARRSEHAHKVADAFKHYDATTATDNYVREDGDARSLRETENELLRESAAAGAKTSKIAKGPKDDSNMKNRDELDITLREEADRESEGLKALKHEPLEQNYVNQDRQREQEINQHMFLTKSRAKADAESLLEVSASLQPASVASVGAVAAWISMLIPAAAAKPPMPPLEFRREVARVFL